mgnify:CR=1 FL=1
MRGISRRFGSVQALRGADFSGAAGEIHALLGENGAGKSTLMHILFGLVPADEGTVEVAGRAARFRSPAEAMAAGLGMVHQHFTQVPAMTVAENVWLGRRGLRYDREAASSLVRRVSQATGLAIDPDATAGDLPVGLRQRLEIVKALAREVRVLILDEPTAALAPGEIAELFGALRRLADSGVAVVLITHKLREVAAIADRVTVLRRGETVVSGEEAGRWDAAALARAMIGESAAQREMEEAMEEGSRGREVRDVREGREGREGGERLALEVRNLCVGSSGGRRVVDGVSFGVARGEIVGIAAVEGNGQRELMRAVAGLVPREGALTIGGSGTIGFVPEDRQGEALILEFSVAENLALGAAGGWWVDRARDLAAADEAIGAFDIQGLAGGRVRTLSGGNQQKVVLARELSRRPALLVAENPTRGLDVRATAEVHARILRAARQEGAGVLFHSTDLDEVLALADRVAVMVEGRWIELPRTATREEVGARMLGGAA